MALNLLPILLLGGGAAYVVTKQKEKARFRSGDDCPPENTVTLNEAISAGQQAIKKYGEGASPFQEAEYYIRTLLPEACNKKSKGSRIKIEIEIESEKLDLDVTVPDLYMIGLLGGINRRVESGKLNQDQGQKFWNQGMEWYKGLMGSNFDPSKLGLEKLAIALAKAMADAIKKGGLAPIPGGQCPDRVTIELTQQKRDEFSKIANGFFETGERNPMTIATELFYRTMPPVCRRSDYKTTVDVKINDGEILLADINFKTYNGASYYAALVVQVIEMMQRKDLITGQMVEKIMNDLRANYKTLTGQDLPSNLI